MVSSRKSPTDADRVEHELLVCAWLGPPFATPAGACDGTVALAARGVTIERQSNACNVLHAAGVFATNTFSIKWPQALRCNRAMLGLSDHQLDVVMDTGRIVPVKRRGVFLERVAAMLKVRGRFTDADVHDVTALALCGLVHAGAALDFEIKYWPDQSR